MGDFIHMQCNVREPYFSQIKSGIKTVEGRLFKSKFKDLKCGNILMFNNGNDSVICQVRGIIIYGTFEEMLTKEGLENCLPDVSSIEEGVKIYKSIPNYAEGEKDEVLAIRINTLF